MLFVGGPFGVYLGFLTTKIVFACRVGLNGHSVLFCVYFILNSNINHKERPEWVNLIIQQLWPSISQFAKKIVNEIVQPKIQDKFESKGLSGFEFEKIDLGSIPPRITGIKVYDKNVSRSEIIIDLDLVLASDCDLNFSLKNLTLLQIKNFSLRGVLRVVFTPLLTDKPLIGGIQYYFMTTPEIDYELGGIANIVNLIPGGYDYVN